MSRRAAVLGASLVLEHVPDLVRYGSKPVRESHRLPEIRRALRAYGDAVAYPPHQVFLGNRRPESLRGLARPWWRDQAPGVRRGPFGDIMPQREFYALLEKVDQFGLVKLGAQPKAEAGQIPLFDDDEVVGAFAGAHDRDGSLAADVLLENLACKASGTHALMSLLESAVVDPASIDYALGCGEEAVGDRYQRGGGAMAKAIAEAAGLANASGADLKAFCAAPVHALVMAGALIEAGVHERVVVVAGGSLAKLGMKFMGALEHGAPIIEDVLAGMAVLVGPADGRSPVLRLDAAGRHRVGSGSSQQALLQDIVVRPLERLGRRLVEIDRYATELHDPEITIPAGGGDVPDRNYRLLAGIAVQRGEIDRSGLAAFVERHGMPGFAPTQGHIASAVPWLPHGLERLRSGEIRSTMLMAKGSLFLGRMTQLWDGVSVILDA